MAALDQQCTAQMSNTLAKDRKEQVGSGMRGDKIRTYQFIHDIVTDHRTGKKMSAAKFMKGQISDLWN